uniref:Aminotransferase class V domain-containing protein n=1 Tax=Ananas comosus var. bracteatus TaxID=296719 RepID=A0A6V7QUV9_ANACO
MRFLLEETNAFLGSIYTSETSNPQQDKYVNSTAQYILDLLNTTQNDYSVIFTPCLSASYHLISEIYHFQRGSVLLASRDNQHAIRHVIKSAMQSNAKVGAVPLRNKDLLIHEQDMHKIIRKQGQNGRRCGLLIYPAQSFSSGICHPLSWIVGAQQHNWEVLLDVSSCLPVVRVDISLYQPEFVIGSTHHILGYPSGVGFLLVRKSAYSVSREKGSVRLKAARTSDDGESVHVVKEGENVSTHIFAALSFGFEHLESIGIEAIQKRGESLISWLVKSLKSLKHMSGEKPLLQLYGSTDRKHRGSILAFNVLDPTGNILPARLVQKLAVRNNIFLGICTLSDPNLSSILHQKPEKRADGANLDPPSSNLEAVRLSLGPISAFEDAYRLAQFLCRFRDEEYMAIEAADYVEELHNSF